MHISRPSFKERELNVRLLAKQIPLVQKQDYFGKAPNVFVGRFGYPRINVGILNTEQYVGNDEPLQWAKNNVQIEQIIALRSAMINSQFKANIKNFSDKFLEISQEVAMASKPVDMEINLAKKPNVDLKLDRFLLPIGSRVTLKKAVITENPKIPGAVEKAVSDSEWKATDAAWYLYQHGLHEHQLTKLLSIGNLGVKMERKLVPTRWSITATDDMLGKKLLQEIQEYQEVECSAYFDGYLGNYFLLLFLPGPWSYELFEMYVGSYNKQDLSRYTTDYEGSGVFRRKNYADNTAGGYYAVRLAILEKLAAMKRKGSILALRFITDEYWAPLGVWVVREASRKALQKKALEFGDEALLLDYAKQFALKKYGLQLENIFKKSKLLDQRNKQKRLTAFP
ncbi:hypothetical protein HYS48_01255 [Candidatus Woesearchaeota archaeon]|nr:hypothetical protein [Candidatus Woesearchaeota archaeon]